MKFGCCISIHNISYAKQFGYDFAELSADEIMKIPDEEWPKTKEFILSANIPINGFNSFNSGELALIGARRNVQKNKEYFYKLTTRAQDLKCKNIGIGAPKTRILEKDYSYEKAQEEMNEFLLYATETAFEKGITVLYEALHPKACNFGNYSKEIYNTVQHLSKPNLHMVWDTYHSSNAGETMTDIVSFLPEIKHVHICSWDQDLHRFYLKQQDSDSVRAVLSFLCSRHFDNTISIEAPDQNFSAIGMESLDVLKKAYYEVKK